MKMMWYAVTWRGLIERIRVSRETERTVHVVDSRGKTNMRRKRTDTGGYFDTWDEAKQFLLDHAEREVAAARRQLELANGKLGNIKGMRRPAESEGA